MNIQAYINDLKQVKEAIVNGDERDAVKLLDDIIQDLKILNLL